MARHRKLTPECKAFINSLLEHYRPDDAMNVQDMLKDLLADILQGMLKAEMDDQLEIIFKPLKVRHLVIVLI